MTTPGSFEYGPDNESVQARLSIDIPTEGIQSLRELANETHRFRVELEAASRASGDFLSYLKQLPQIQSQIVMAQRALTAQLERTIDAEQRLTAGGISGVPTGTFQQPWSGVSSGMGGRPPSLSDIAYQMGQLDTRTLYMMNNERPSGLRPGDINPQNVSDEQLAQNDKRALDRDQAKTDQLNKTGPGQRPSDLFSKAKMAQNLAAPVLNEMGPGGSWPGLLGSLAQGAGGLGMLLKTLGGGALSSIGLGGLAGPLGALGSAIAPIAGPLGLAAGGLALFEKGGNVVEGWRQMGQVRGGGWKEGLGYEAQIRTMALNPFITTDQARKMVQGALSEGYSGKEYDTVTQFVADNLKNMNVDIANSFQLLRKAVKEGGATPEEVKKTLEEQQKLSKEGYLTAPERQKGLTEGVDALTAMGLGGPQALQAAATAQNMWSGDQTLAGHGNKLLQSMQRPNFMIAAAMREGIQLPPGTLPNMVPRKLQEMGINPMQVGSDYLKQYAQLAQQASNGDHDRAVAIFQYYLRSVAPELPEAQDFDAAEKMYNSYVGGEDPERRAAGQAGEKPKPTSQTPLRVGGTSAAIMSKSGPGRLAAEQYGGSQLEVVNNEGQARGYTGDQQQRDQLARGTSNWRHKGEQGPGTPLSRTPQNAQLVNNYYGSTGGGSGQPSYVQGTLNINVNPSEFQRALGVPHQVPLSANEQQANMGYGVAQRNTPPPGYGQPAG